MLRKTGANPLKNASKKPEYKLTATPYLEAAPLRALKPANMETPAREEQGKTKARRSESGRAAFAEPDTRQARRARLDALAYDDFREERADRTRVNPFAYAGSETEPRSKRSANPEKESAESAETARRSIESDRVLSFPSGTKEPQTRLARRAREEGSLYEDHTFVRVFSPARPKTAEEDRRSRTAGAQDIDDDLYDTIADETYAAEEEPQTRLGRARKRALEHRRTEEPEAIRAEAANANTDSRVRAKQAKGMQVKQADLSNNAQKRTPRHELLTRMERKRAAQFSKEEERGARRHAMFERTRQPIDRDKTLYPARKPDDFNGSPRRAIIIAGSGLVLTIAVLALLMFSDGRPQLADINAQSALSTPYPTATADVQPTQTMPAGVTITPAPTLSNVTGVPQSPSPTLTVTPTPKPSASATPKPTATVTPRPTAPPTQQPTAPPTQQPTAPPTPQPTAPPTPQPTAPPTPEPTAPPTEAPTADPTV